MQVTYRFIYLHYKKRQLLVYLQYVQLVSSFTSEELSLLARLPILTYNSINGVH